jgi:hypothetical protein
VAVVVAVAGAVEAVAAVGVAVVGHVLAEGPSVVAERVRAERVRAERVRAERVRAEVRSVAGHVPARVPWEVPGPVEVPLPVILDQTSEVHPVLVGLAPAREIFQTSVSETGHRWIHDRTWVLATDQTREAIGRRLERFPGTVRGSEEIDLALEIGPASITDQGSPIGQTIHSPDWAIDYRTPVPEPSQTTA